MSSKKEFKPNINTTLFNTMVKHMLWSPDLNLNDVLLNNILDDSKNEELDINSLFLNSFKKPLAIKMLFSKGLSPEVNILKEIAKHFNALGEGDNDNVKKSVEYIIFNNPKCLLEPYKEKSDFHFHDNTHNWTSYEHLITITKSTLLKKIFKHSLSDKNFFIPLRNFVSNMVSDSDMMRYNSESKGKIRYINAVIKNATEFGLFDDVLFFKNTFNKTRSIYINTIIENLLHKESSINNIKESGYDLINSYLFKLTNVGNAYGHEDYFYSDVGQEKLKRVLSNIEKLVSLGFNFDNLKFDTLIKKYQAKNERCDDIKALTTEFLLNISLKNQEPLNPKKLSI